MTKAIQKIKELTENNEHTEARLEAATLLNDELLINTYKGIMSAHITLGYMSDNLMADRNHADLKLHQVARASMTNEQYQEFYNAF